MEYVPTTVNTADLQGANNDTAAAILADWHKTKAHVYPCLLSQTTYQNNSGHLAHDDFMDLAIGYYIRVPGGETTDILWISEKSLAASGITKDTLRKQALVNLTHDGYKIHDMGSILAPYLDLPPDDKSCALPMFVLTNQGAFLGAAGILLNGLLSQFSELIGSFYVLPSSLHEAILVPAEGQDASELNAIIRSVNTAQVQPLEQLSNNAYYFDKDTCKMKIAK